MNGIFELMCESNKVGLERFKTKKKAEKSKIIALAIVERGYLRSAGVSEVTLLDGTLAANEVIEKVRGLELQCKGVFFPSKSIFIERPQPEEIMENQVFGLKPEAEPTGEVKVTLNATYGNYFSTQTVMFFNDLRASGRPVDLVYWTQNYVHVVQDKDVVFKGIGGAISGNKDETVLGKFSMVYYQDGEDVPYGFVDSSLLEDYTHLTITEPNVDSAVLVKDTCVSGCTTYRTAQGGPLNATLTFDIVEDASCVEWVLTKDCATSAVEANDPLVIANGVVTITNLGVGTHKYRTHAVTACGVKGDFCFSIVVKP